MKLTARSPFSKRQAEDHELGRRLDLTVAERMVQALPSRERTKRRAVIGDRVFSLQDMLEEMRAGTPYGECFRVIFKRMSADGPWVEKP